MRRSLFTLWRDEFAQYDATTLRQDLLAGLTVAAVALPLALAFGVSSGATAAAGLVTAILAGIVIGALSGAPYQISGPTGAMSAVLILLAQQHGLPGVWLAGVMAGVLLLIIGILRLGRFIAFVPAPVITGFTSGIALIIAIGQIDNFLGVKTPGAESAALKLIGYLRGGFMPDWRAALIGFLVVAIMLAWPKRWAARFPASLLGLIVVTALSVLLRWDVPAIGAIPQTLLLSDRLRFSDIPWQSLSTLIAPTVSITALAAVESLLCGAVASNMTGIRLQANQELVAQGIGNLLIPFFGGVPATAAIARTSVGIKSGGRTRLVSIFHALTLLASMFVLAPIMSRIPLAALAGVLMVTAWRMNEWEAARFMFRHRFKSAIIAFLITMATTVMFDLTQAIVVGAVLSALIFLNQSASMEITTQAVDAEKLRQRGIGVTGNCPHVRVAYLTGPLFFAATNNFNEAFADLECTRVLILSMRATPLIDTSGLLAIEALHKRLHAQGGTLMLAALSDKVRQMLDRSGLTDLVGADRLFWSADQAIVAAETLSCACCAKDARAGGD